MRQPLSIPVSEMCLERQRLYFAMCDAHAAQLTQPSKLHEARWLLRKETYARHYEECPHCSRLYRLTPPGNETRSDAEIAASVASLLRQEVEA